MDEILILAPSRPGRPSILIGKPCIRISNSEKTGNIYFYSEAAAYLAIKEGDGLRLIIDQSGEIFIHHIPKESRLFLQMPSHKIHKRTKDSFHVQIRKLLEVSYKPGMYEVLPLGPHPVYKDLYCNRLIYFQK